MSINKYGIIIKKRLEEKYPKKYQELKDKNELLSLIKEKQFDIIVYKSNLIENTTKQKGIPMTTPMCCLNQRLQV